MKKLLLGPRQSILLLVFPIFLIFTSWQYATANDAMAGIQSLQQKKTIVKGVVKDEKGEPLIGVSIALKNSTQGTMTDIDGNYSISIETENPELIFSYIGYTSQTVVVNGRTEINVTLKEESHVLNEVVVTAMGIMRKEKSLTYATQQIKSEDLNKVQDPNVEIGRAHV